MKKILLSLFASFCVVTLFAQNVDWTFKAVKKNASSYDIVAVAKIPAGWHLYSQHTPSGGPVPTSFTFNKNPLVTKVGKTSEAGKVYKIKDKNFGVDVLYYGNTVTFKQNMKVKGRAKTNVTGSVEYMICNDHECLPPVTKHFNVKL